jgi:hydrogenase nickel insertion protein HypA
MHEMSVVAAMIQSLQAQLVERGVQKVTAVRVRRGSTFSEESLRQSFQALSVGTLMEGAELFVETVDTKIHCSCGKTWIVTADDLTGHMFMCPNCGDIHEVDEAHDLVLLDVVGEAVDEYRDQVSEL